MLTDHIGHTFRLDLAGMAVFRRGVIFCTPVQHGVADFVEHGFDGLPLAHLRANLDFAGDRIEAAFGHTGRCFIQNGNRRGACNGVRQFRIICNIAGQFTYTDAGKLFAFRLGNVKNGNDSEPYKLNQRALPDRLTGCIQNGIAACIQLILLDEAPVRAWRKNFDPMLSGLNCSAEVLVPRMIPGHTGCSRVLHQNQHDIAEAVRVKFGHRGQVFRVPSTGEYLADALFQLFGQFLDFFIRRRAVQFKAHRHRSCDGGFSACSAAIWSLAALSA